MLNNENYSLRAAYEVLFVVQRALWEGRYELEQKIKKETLTLALSIALLPPLWAVLAPYIGISTGAVGLICAGIYVANGNKKADAVKLSLGFLLGDAWAVLALWLMDLSPLQADLTTFFVLFALGATAVLLASALPKAVYLPAWLCGWAVGLSIMAPMGFTGIGSYPLQIAVAMLVGVWYVGCGVAAFQKLLCRQK